MKSGRNDFVIPSPIERGDRYIFFVSDIFQISELRTFLTANFPWLCKNNYVTWQKLVIWEVEFTNFCSILCKEITYSSNPRFFKVEPVMSPLTVEPFDKCPINSVATWQWPLMTHDSIPSWQCPRLTVSPSWQRPPLDSVPSWQRPSWQCALLTGSTIHINNNTVTIIVTVKLSFRVGIVSYTEGSMYQKTKQNSKLISNSQQITSEWTRITRVRSLYAPSCVGKHEVCVF